MKRIWAMLVVSAVAGAEEPWFQNVSKTAGLEGVAGTDVILADVNGDGWWDLVVGRERFFLSEKGKTWKEWSAHGIEFPEVTLVPMTAEGTADTAKGKKTRLVPSYLYFADVDNDGDVDALAGVHSSWEAFDGRGWNVVKECDHGVRSAVWLNDGKGKFSRGPASGYTAKDAYGPAMALAICDSDNDGKLDLYEGREYRQYGVLYGCGVDRLWKGDGKGGFTDVTKSAGMWLKAEPGAPDSARPSYGVTHADWNNDGKMDLLEMAYGRQWNLLWKNKGDGTFEEVGVPTNFAGDGITHGRYPEGVNRPPEKPFRSNGNTFDAAVADYDNDGDLDVFLGEIQHAWAGEASDPPSLLINEGAENNWSFRRVPVTEFLPKREFRDPKNFNYGDLRVAWADIDNDGLQDLLIGSGDYPDGQFLRLYRQKADHSFEEATTAAGFNWEGCAGLSIGDFDRDGDVDIVAGRSFMRLSQEHLDKYMGGIKVNEIGVFRNDIGNASKNHWLVLRLEGVDANRAAIGARVTVVSGGVTQIREVRAGSGLANHQDPPEVHFGLGAATVIDELRIRWPDSKLTEQVFKKVAVDRFATIRQGEKSPKLEPAAGGK